MVQRGVIEEVAAVMAEGLMENAPGLDSIGMREAVAYLQGRIPRDAVAETIATSTRQYAKRQETWFRHQLTGAVLTLDATKGPDVIAGEIHKAWTSI
jgi:tRNA dimethylallyltransferase